MLVRPADRARIIIVVMFCVGVQAPSMRAQGHTRQTRVLLLFQQQAETRPMVEFSQALRLTIQSELASPVEFYEESLDLDRFGAGDRLTSLAEYVGGKYRGFGIDVVVPVGARALRFAVNQVGDVFAGVPIVFALTAPPQTDPATLPRNVTGRLGVVSRFAPTIAMARRLQPDARQFVVVGGATAQDSNSVDAVVNALRSADDTLPISILQGFALGTLLNKLRALPERSIVLFANYRGDGQGQVFDPVDIVGSIARASAAPMYTQLRSYVGEGVVGGSVTSFADEGTQTARLILRVVRRRHGAPMPPVENVGSSFVVDWRQLQRWGFSEALLPRGTEVLFREPTSWERYRTVALLTVAVITAESVLIGLLLLERRRRKRAQLALADQAAYEQLIAELTADAAHHSLESGTHGLEQALARIVRYTRAEAAALVQYSETNSEAAMRMCWPHESSLAQADSTYATTGSAGQRRTSLEIPLVADGATIGMLSLRRLEDGDGWPTVLVKRVEAACEILARAITRARATHAIEEARRQVAHMARVALIGELAATMSHELRQPLAAIRANAEAGALLLKRSTHEQDVAREIFQNIVADDARAVEVIEGVRRLLRKDASEATNVDVNRICAEAVRLLEPDARRRDTRLELSLAPTLPMLVGDPIQLQQVLLNLILNGLEAASTSTTERLVIVHTEMHGAHVNVEVRDSGPGIAASVQPHLFESFFSTKSGGLGLGLVIVQSIVERHHGQVRAENLTLGGAVFRVRLPVLNAPRATDAIGLPLAPRAPMTAEN